MQLAEFIQGYDHFIFFSPHLDDAILSCGSLLLQLKKFRKDVTVITVFTKAAASPPYPPQAWEFLAACGYSDADSLFVDRKLEDAKAMKYLGAKKVHWDYNDATWRKTIKNQFVYKNSPVQFSGKLAREDLPLLHELVEKMKKFVKLQNSNTIYLGPLGVGGHADHVLVREAMKRLTISKLFWEDYPYNNVWINKIKFLEILKYKLLFEEEWLKEKAQMIKMYKTQVPTLFPDNTIPKRKEKYYTANRS